MKSLVRILRKVLGSHYFWLVLVLGAGFWVRLYKIDSPIADWHSWRQADTSAVSRNFLKYGFDVLHPRFDDLSNIPSGRENPEGWRFVEFPIFNLLQAAGFKFFPVVSLEVWGRLVSIMASLLSAVVLWGLVGRYRGKGWGVVTAAVFLFIPFNIYYSRTILPEPTAVFLGLLGYWLFVVWEEEDKNWTFWVSGVAWAGALLAKPVIGFLGLPLVFLVVRKYGLREVWWQGRLWVWGLLVMGPFLAWRGWIGRFPEGLPHYKWLLNGDGIRFRPAWWRWIFGERVGRLVLGGWGLVPFVTGLVVRWKKGEGHLWWFLAGAVLYLAVFATGNVRHDYYQIIIGPAVAVVFSWGMWWWWQGVGMNKWKGRLLLVFCILMGWGLSWYQVREFYKVNRPEIVEAGRRVDELLPEEAKVIAPYNGDTAFLYQTGRRGWPYVTLPIEEMIDRLGAEYYVSVNFDGQTRGIMERYEVVEEKEEFVVVKLEEK